MRTYGTITHEVEGAGRKARGRWLVRCEPHVAVRIKRVFSRADPGRFGALELADTPENARELAWFLARYPMDLSPEARLHLERREAAHRDREDAVAAILAGSGRPRAMAELAMPLRPYQAQAVELALRTGGLLVADDVGLGKTAQAIGLIANPECRPAVVVTLPHLPRQWAAEIAKFAPDLDVYLAKTGSPTELNRTRRRKAERPMLSDGPDVVVLNYHKLGGWAEHLAGRVKGVVYDEVQELRHDSSAKYAAAVHVSRNAEYRLGLSATPIYNYGGEMFNVLSALAPGQVGERSEFTREWCEGWGGKVKIRDPKVFGGYLRESGLMLRRTRADVGRELPRLSRVVETIDADLEKIHAVEGRAEELAAIILHQGGLDRGAKMQAAEELSWRLRQATGLAKAHAAADFVRMVVEGSREEEDRGGESVLLYGWHREVYSIWADRLADLGIAFFTGEESESQKAEALVRFKAGEVKVLAMSLRAGAGVDGLQGSCRTVVFGELDWSPGAMEQAIGRVYRDGQADPVYAYFLVADCGSDPIVTDVLGLKRQQIEGIRDPEGDLVEKLEVDGGHIKRLAEAFLAKRKEVAA